ncbi:MAG: undecaprenyldiphospho-muramoylpentapeptide beta-N-acetylglucosaminyltransferase [Acidobacteriota bacterium]
MNTLDPKSSSSSSAAAQGLALLAGGGTGGHVFPALVVAQEMRRRGWSVAFAGKAGGIEARLAEQADLAFHPIEARPLVGRGVVGKLRALWTTLRSAGSARALVRRLDARVVLGTGGYICAPAVLGAWLAGRPALLLEPNGRAGVANRWLSRWSKEVLVSWRSAEADFPTAVRCIGTPVRPDFFEVQPLRQEELEGREERRILILGGSQGAAELNRRLPPVIARLREAIPSLRVVHQCGERHAAAARSAYDDLGLGDEVEVIPFISDVAAAMANADLVLSRAGAITLAELCAAGRPALLLPLSVALGHQRDNAAALVEAEAAELVAAQESPEQLSQRALAWLTNASQLERRAAAARSLALPGAAAAAADRLEAWAGGSSAGLSEPPKRRRSAGPSTESQSSEIESTPEPASDGGVH